MTLFAVEVVLLTREAFLLLSGFDAVQATGGAWERRDLRLEVTLTAPRLAHLMLVELSAIVHFKFVVTRPETVTYLGLARPSEVLAGLQQLRRVLLLLLLKCSADLLR